MTTDIILTEENNYFNIANYFSELTTNKERALARKNLGINLSDFEQLSVQIGQLKLFKDLFGFGENDTFLKTKLTQSDDGTVTSKYVWEKLSLVGTEDNLILVTKQTDGELTSSWLLANSSLITMEDTSFNSSWSLHNTDKVSIQEVFEVIVNYLWYVTPSIKTPNSSTVYKEVGSQVPGGKLTLLTNGVMDSASYTLFNGSTNSLDVKQLASGIEVEYSEFTATTNTASITKQFTLNCSTHDKDNKKVTLSTAIKYIFRYPYYIGYKPGNVEITETLVSSLLQFGTEGSTSGAKTLSKAANTDVTYLVILPYPQTITNATDPGSMNASVKSDFLLVLTMDITRNANTHKYNIYKFHPTNPFANSVAFNITIA